MRIAFIDMTAAQCSRVDWGRRPIVLLNGKSRSGHLGVYEFNLSEIIERRFEIY